MMMNPVTEWCRKYPHGTAPNEEDREVVFAVYGLQDEPTVVFETGNDDAIAAAELCIQRWPSRDMVASTDSTVGLFCDAFVLLIGVTWTAEQLAELSKWVYGYVLLETEPTGRRHAYPSGGRTLTQFMRDVLFPMEAAMQKPD